MNVLAGVGDKNVHWQNFEVIQLSQDRAEKPAPTSPRGKGWIVIVVSSTSPRNKTAWRTHDGIYMCTTPVCLPLASTPAVLLFKVCLRYRRKKKYQVPCFVFVQLKPISPTESLFTLKTSRHCFTNTPSYREKMRNFCFLNHLPPGKLNCPSKTPQTPRKRHRGLLRLMRVA